MDKILAEFRRNARTKLMDMSRMQREPVTTIHYRLQKTKEYVRRYVTMLDFSKLEYKRTLLVIESDEPGRVMEALENANNIYRSQKTLLVEIIYRDREEVSEIKRRLLECGAGFSEHPLTEPLKQEQFEP